jgi:hypothetical protein
MITLAKLTRFYPEVLGPTGARGGVMGAMGINVHLANAASKEFFYED